MANTTVPTKNKGCVIAIIAIILVAIIIKPSLVLSFNFFLFLHKLFYTSGVVPFEVLFTIFGLFAGAVCGAWVARRRYNLAAKWVWYPIGGLTLFLLVFLLANDI